MSAIPGLLFSKKFILPALLACCLALPVYSGSANTKTEALQFYTTGNNYYTAEKYEDALIEYDNAVNLDPDYFYLISERGIFEKTLKTKQENIAKAVKKICSELIENEKDNVDFYVYYYLGWAELNLHEKDQAQLHLKNAVQMMKKEEIPSNDVQALLKQTLN